MVASIGPLREGLWRKAQAFTHSNLFRALFHTPLLGGFWTLALLPYLINRREQLHGAVNEGIVAQMVIPGIFSVGSLLRYFVWLFELDLVSEIMGYLLVVYLVAGYALMAANAWRVFKGKSPDYKWLQKPIQRCVPLIFS